MGEKIRKDPRFKSLSVFVLTTSDEERDKIAAYNFNIAGYILNPIESD
jgi:DNA-binding NarL/FixJ family response regulator